MNGKRRARDVALLDVLDALPRVAIDQTIWRVVHRDRDPLLCHRSAGRWDLGHFDVLYTALDADGAIAEMYFHLSRQPVFPSTAPFTLNEIAVKTRSTLRFADLRALEPLGVTAEGYSSLLYARTQEIGDAAAFLGFDGLVAPSARWDGLNLVLFCDNLSPEDLKLRRSTAVDWNAWREKHGKR